MAGAGVGLGAEGGGEVVVGTGDGVVAWGSGWVAACQQAAEDKEATALRHVIWWGYVRASGTLAISLC